MNAAGDKTRTRSLAGSEAETITYQQTTRKFYDHADLQVFNSRKTDSVSNQKNASPNLVLCQAQYLGIPKRTGHNSSPIGKVDAPKS